MGVTIQVSGLDAMLSKLNKLANDNGRTARVITEATSDNIITEAKQSAPADLGKIRQNLNWVNNGDGTNILINLFCNAPEAIYQEFGTGPMVDVPEQFADVAATGQNSGTGTWADFIAALTDWIARHGLLNTYSIDTKRVSHKASKDDNEQLAWVIARKILRDGLKPQPFLYPAIINNMPKYMEKLNIAYKSLLTS